MSRMYSTFVLVGFNIVYTDWRTDNFHVKSRVNGLIIALAR